MMNVLTTTILEFNRAAGDALFAQTPMLNRLCAELPYEFVEDMMRRETAEFLTPTSAERAVPRAETLALAEMYAQAVGRLCDPATIDALTAARKTAAALAQSFSMRGLPHLALLFAPAV